MFPVSRTYVVQTKQCVGNQPAARVSEVYVLALYGHDNCRTWAQQRDFSSGPEGNKQDVNGALVLQTSPGAKATSPVTLFTLYTDNYRNSFLGFSLCTW